MPYPPAHNPGFKLHPVSYIQHPSPKAPQLTKFTTHHAQHTTNHPNDVFPHVPIGPYHHGDHFHHGKPANLSLISFHLSNNSVDIANHHPLPQASLSRLRRCPPPPGCHHRHRAQQHRPSRQQLPPPRLDPTLRDGGRGDVCSDWV